MVCLSSSAKINFRQGDISFEKAREEQMRVMVIHCEIQIFLTALSNRVPQIFKYPILFEVLKVDVTRVLQKPDICRV